VSIRAALILGGSAGLAVLKATGVAFVPPRFTEILYAKKTALLETPESTVVA